MERSSYGDHHPETDQYDPGGPAEQAAHPGPPEHVPRPGEQQNVTAQPDEGDDGVEEHQERHASGRRRAPSRDGPRRVPDTACGQGLGGAAATRSSTLPDMIVRTWAVMCSSGQSHQAASSSRATSRAS